MIRKDNGRNNSLFLSCQMGQSDGAFFMIKHTPLPNGNHHILFPICPMGVADTLAHVLYLKLKQNYFLFLLQDEQTTFFTQNAQVWKKQPKTNVDRLSNFQWAKITVGFIYTFWYSLSSTNSILFIIRILVKTFQLASWKVFRFRRISTTF